MRSVCWWESGSLEDADTPWPLLNPPAHACDRLANCWDCHLKHTHTQNLMTLIFADKKEKYDHVFIELICYEQNNYYFCCSIGNTSPKTCTYSYKTTNKSRYHLCLQRTAIAISVFQVGLKILFSKWPKLLMTCVPQWILLSYLLVFLTPLFFVHCFVPELLVVLDKTSPVVNNSKSDLHKPWSSNSNIMT